MMERTYERFFRERLVGCRVDYDNNLVTNEPPMYSLLVLYDVDVSLRILDLWKLELCCRELIIMGMISTHQ